jgi:hypothetical protein
MSFPRRWIITRKYNEPLILRAVLLGSEGYVFYDYVADTRRMVMPRKSMTPYLPDMNKLIKDKHRLLDGRADAE